MIYELHHQYLFTIGKLNQNNIYEVDILISFETRAIYQKYINNIILNNKIPEKLDDLAFYNNNIIITNNNIKEGIAYKLNNYEENHKLKEIKDNTQIIKNNKKQNMINWQNNEFINKGKQSQLCYKNPLINNEKKLNLELYLKNNIKHLIKYYLFNKGIRKGIEI